MTRQDLLLWFALSAVWGASFILISVSLESFPPLWVAFLRSVCGALVLWVVLRARRVRLPPRRFLGVLLVVALLNNALPWTLFAAGQQTVSSGVAAILNATTPLFSLGLALLLRDAQVNVRLGVGVLLGLAGVALTVSGSLLTGHATALGTALILVAAASYAFATALSKAQLGSVGVLGLATAQLSLAALMLAPAALLGPPPGPLTASAVAGVVALGVFGSGLAYLMFYALLSRTSATQTTSITYALPVWGLFWAAVAGEWVGLWPLLGVAVVLLGLLLIGGSRRPAVRPA